ncbi:MAG: phosphate ABC transporter substrate-binding protein [Gemmataceae bacterium]
MNRRMVFGIVVATLGLFFEPNIVAAQNKLTIEGSTTVGPIVDAFAEVFMKEFEGLKITIRKTGSGNGAVALVKGQCNIAAMSRFMKGKEFQTAVAKGVLPCVHTVAMDGVCIVMHPANPVKKLKMSQLRDIYLGKISNWNELGGPDAKIVLVSRDSSSGTYETFRDIVMSGKKLSSATEYVNSNPAMHARVSKTKFAIGYLGLGFVDKKVRAISVDGVTPTRRTIARGTYPIARPLFLWTNGYPKPGSMIHRFVTFHLSEEGQEIIEAKGFVPVTDY